MHDRMMANLAVFHKWHSSGTDNRKHESTDAEEQWLNLSDTNPVHTHSSLNTRASQAHREGHWRERLKATAVHAQRHPHSHTLTS